MRETPCMWQHKYRGASCLLPEIFHPHALLIAGGFDEEKKFVYLPISSTLLMTELFRKLLIKHV